MGGPTEIRTRAAGFKVQRANLYTMGPVEDRGRKVTALYRKSAEDKFSFRMCWPASPREFSRALGRQH